MTFDHLWKDARPEAEQYAEFVGMIRDGRPLSFSRWGNGEFNCVFSKVGRNASGHEYFPDLGARLRQVLDSAPEYRLGLQPLAVRQRGAQILQNFSHIPWSGADFLYKASMKTGIDDLFSALRGQGVILVGPPYIVALQETFPFRHITVPLKNCWLDYARVLDECRAALNSRDPSRFTVVVFVASMMTNVLVDDLHREFAAARRVSLLDCGSLFDPYVGKRTRKYHKQVMRRLADERTGRMPVSPLP